MYLKTCAYIQSNSYWNVSAQKADFKMELMMLNTNEMKNKNKPGMVSLYLGETQHEKQMKNLFSINSG